MEEILRKALNKGVEMHNVGEFDLAGQLYNSVLKVQPEHADANHNMGLLKVETGQALEALPYLQTALQADTSVAQFWLSYIKALIKLDKTDEVTRILNLAKESGIENEELLKLYQELNETFTKTKLDQSETDIVSHTKPNVLDTLNIDKAIRLAQKKAKTGAVEESKQILEDILYKFPKNKRARRSLADLGKTKKSSTNKTPQKEKINKLIKLYNQGQLPAAVDLAQALTEQYPEAFTLWNILGAAYAGLGQLDAALESYREATKLKPDYAEAFFNIGSVLQEKAKLEEAIAAYNKALKLQPNYYEALYNVGLSFQDRGDHEKAIDAYKKALSLRPDHAEAHYYLGNALYDRGNVDAAIQAYNKAIGIKPDYADAFTMLSIALKEQTKLGEPIKA